MALPLKVRGTCGKCGHVVTTTAAKGRATWRGPCPAEGCDGKVYASRIKEPEKTKPGAGAPADTTPPPAAGRPRRTKVVRVRGYTRSTDAGPKPAGSDVRPPAGTSDGPAAGGAGDDAGKPAQRPPAAKDGPKRPPRADRTEAGTRPARAPHAASGYGYDL